MVEEVRDHGQIMSATEGGRGVWKVLTITDKRERGFRQVVTITDKMVKLHMSIVNPYH